MIRHRRLKHWTMFVLTGSFQAVPLPQQTERSLGRPVSMEASTEQHPVYVAVGNPLIDAVLSLTLRVLGDLNRCRRYIRYSSPTFRGEAFFGRHELTAGRTRCLVRYILVLDEDAVCVHPARHIPMSCHALPSALLRGILLVNWNPKKQDSFPAGN